MSSAGLSHFAFYLPDCSKIRDILGLFNNRCDVYFCQLLKVSTHVLTEYVTNESPVNWALDEYYF